MRKAIFLLVLASVGLLPVAAMASVVGPLPEAAMADVGGSAEATLILAAVIAVSIYDNWDDLTIEQGDIAGWPAGAIIDWNAGGGSDIAVTVKALTDFKLYGCYYAKEGGADVNPPFGDPNDLIILNDGASDYTLVYQEITNPGSCPGSYDDLTLLATFAGDNNISIGGSDYKYEVKLKPQNLGDRESGETIDFTIVFVVEEGNDL